MFLAAFLALLAFMVPAPPVGCTMGIVLIVGFTWGPAEGIALFLALGGCDVITSGSGSLPMACAIAEALGRGVLFLRGGTTMSASGTGSAGPTLLEAKRSLRASSDAEGRTRFTAGAPSGGT